ncbi:MAG: hypothetical protein KDJ16_01910 [Hyphomicrobiales bacterium]|nr:hypothetical protein [Hyphomicrobiales bacterium]
MADRMVSVNNAVDETKSSSTRVGEASVRVREDTVELRKQVEGFLSAVGAA